MTADDLQESMEDPLFFSSFSSPLLAALPTLRTRRKRGQKGKKFFFLKKAPLRAIAVKAEAEGLTRVFLAWGCLSGMGKERRRRRHESSLATTQKGRGVSSLPASKMRRGKLNRQTSPLPPVAAVFIVAVAETAGTAKRDFRISGIKPKTFLRTPFISRWI